MSIFIGGAWPYANGSLHVGHIAGLLPGDVLARYFRLKGTEVLYVSGSDCNGTPISIRAKHEKVTPTRITNRYHKEFVDCFSKLGFSYDMYTRTDQQQHHEVVQQVFLKLLAEGLLYTKSEEQVYCEIDEQFLPDRYVEGKCPNCGSDARGDQCEICSAIFEPIELRAKRCKLCGSSPTIRSTEHFYFALSTIQQQIEEFFTPIKHKGTWRENAVQLTERYLLEGLRDRAATRDLPIGVPVPLKGYDEKKIYVWIEAVTGYLSASMQWGKQNNVDWRRFWNEGTSTYYVHGKDNIPFHSIIWPAILLGLGEKSLPDYIFSSEYMTLEKRKISTSKNWAVWIPDLLERYDPDSIRYYLLINAPENRDTDFSWREFIYSHNSELLGAFGNFVNRSFKFIEKYFDGNVPEGYIDATIKSELQNLYQHIGQCIEQGHFKRAIEDIFLFIRQSNKYFDEQKPWIQIKEDKKNCEQTLFTCIQIITNLSVLLQPFLPFSCKKIAEMLQLDHISWAYTEIQQCKLDHVTALFERIDVNQIDEEVANLQQQ
ncbi:methionine--tRNA ligase [Cytobacillus sp. Hm23]